MARKISELFWELRARSEGLKKDLDDSERHLGRFAKFVGDHPMAAVAAFGTAMLGVGAKAVQMAAHVDGAMRQIQANLPAGTQHMAALREEIAAVARESGRAQDEIMSAANEIARLGVGSAEELAQRLRGVTLLADATGSSVTTIVGGLDQVMDAFGLSADEAVQSLASIASAARGRSDVDALFAAFQAATPKLRELGIDAATATKALVALVDRGLTAKKAAAALNELDAAGVRELAKQAHISADALKELEERAETVRGSLDRTQQRGLNAFNEKMEALGEKILPLVNKELAGVLGLIDKLDGTGTKITLGADAATVTTLGRLANQGKLKNASPDAQDRFREAGGNLVRGIYRGDVDLGSMSLQQLTDLRAGLLAYENETNRVGEHVPTIYRNVAKAMDEAIQRARTLTKETKTGSGGGGGGGGGGLTDEQKRKIQAARDALADQLAALTPDKADDFERKLAKLVRTSLEAGLSANEVNEAIRKMREQLVTNMAVEFDNGTGKGTNSQLEGAVARSIRESVEGALAEIRGRDADLAAETARIAAEITTTLVDDLQVELDQQLQKMGEQGIPEALRKAFARSRGFLIAAKGVGESVDRGLEGVDNLPGRLRQMQALVALEKEVAAGTLAIATSDGTAEEKAAAMVELKKLLLKIEEKRREVVKEQADAEDEGSVSLRQHIEDVSGAIANAAQFAYGLAQAFGVADSEVGQLLASVEQLATGIEKLAEGKILEGGVQTVASLVSIGRKLFGGESAEEKRHRQQQSDAIARLIDTITTGIRGTGQTLQARLQGGRNEIADARRQVEEQLAGKKNEAERNRRLAELNRLEKERLDQITREYAEEQRRAREDYEVRRLKALGLDDEAEALAQAAARQREYQAAVEGGADALTLAALAAAQAAEAAQEAAEAEQRRRQQLLDDVGTELEIMDVTDPTAQLARRAEVYQSFGGALGSLFEGLDLADPADVATLDARIRELFQQLDDAPDSVDLAGLSIDELIRYLLDLDSAADAVAAGVKTAADAFNEAVGTLDVDAEIAGKTDPTKYAGDVAGAAGTNFSEIAGALAGIDLSTEEGRKKAESALQALYSANKGNQPLVAAIRTVLKAIRAVPGAMPDEGAGGSGTSIGQREVVANAARSLTEVTGSRMADYLASIDIGVKALPEEIAAELDRWFAPIITGPVFPPPLPSSWGRGPGASPSPGGDAGGVSITVQVQVIMDGTDLENPRGFGEQLGAGIAQAINTDFAKWYREGQVNRRGNIDRPGVT